MAPNLVFFLLLAPIAHFTTHWAPNCRPAMTDGTQKKIKKFARVHMVFYSIITWQVMNPADDGTTLITRSPSPTGHVTHPRVNSFGSCLPHGM